MANYQIENKKMGIDLIICCYIKILISSSFSSCFQGDPGASVIFPSIILTLLSIIMDKFNKMESFTLARA